MRALSVSLIVSCLALPLTSHAAALRCGNQLASEGSTPAEVVSKCGSPMDQRTQSIPVQQEMETVHKKRYSRTVFKRVEEWTYNFGPNRLLQVVVFENGQLVDVRSGGYGH